MSRLRPYPAAASAGRMVPRRRVGAWRRLAVITQAALLGIATGVLAPTQVMAEPAPDTLPSFVDGQAQPVFLTGSANWINYELWVEAPMDSDGDGKLDRIHADVSRVRETDTEGLKVPAIIEASPYYAGTVNVVNWNVNHELGFPPATREVRNPSISNTSPTISTTFESFWVPRGFAVMHVEGTGTGKSTGCASVGDPVETIGPKAVIDWLNGRAKGYTTVDGDVELTAYWHNGHSAMIGTSYNGTLPNAVASTGVEGLEAIVPISAISSWYDYYRANGMVRAPQTFQGEDLDVLGEYIYSRADQQICRQKSIYDLRALQDRATGDYNAAWDARNYMNDVSKVHAAVLVAHGNNDWNVMTRNAFQWYEALKARGVPHQLYYHTGGHGGAPPNDMLNRWFTHYLWRQDNGVENDPIARIVRPADTCPDSARAAGPDQPNVTNIQVVDSSKLAVGNTVTVQFTTATNTVSTTSRTITAIPDGTHITVSAAVATATGQRIVANQIIYRCSTAFPSAYPEFPDPDSHVATMRFLPAAPAIGQLSFQPVVAAEESLIDNAALSTSSTQELGLTSTASSPNRLAYRTPAFSKDVRISGTTMINMRVKFSAAKANVTALLVAYPPTGNPFIVDRGWLDPENRGGDYSVTQPMTPDTYYNLRFNMQGKDYIVPAGQRLGVVLLSSDGMSTIRPAAGLVMTVDLANSSVELPIVGGAAAIASATGVVAPTVDYTLDPASPNGSNGWYKSGDVALTWQTNETGAETSTTGCVNETFSTDGVFSRSCTRTNVVGTAGPVEVTVMRDVTMPVLAPTVSPSLVAFGGTATASANATDATSGVASQSCDPVVTSVAGDFTVACVATDVAGNTATATASYTVASPLTSGSTICTGPFSGSGTDVIVPAGATCTLLAGTNVRRDVKVQKGGTLIDLGAVIGHDLSADQPAGIQVTGGSVGHDLSIKGLSGSPVDGNYVRDVTVAHDLVVQNSTSAIVVSGNTVGHDLRVQGNKPGGVTVTANSAGHDAVCKSNSPQSGSGNTGAGANSCPS